MNQGFQEQELPLAIDLKSLKTGDMPGDRINISQSHIKRARVCMGLLANTLAESKSKKTVISIYGGSGTGKSEVASVLAYYCDYIGKSAHIISGDNYPYRIPKDNDRERLRIFRQGGLKEAAKSARFTSDWIEKIKMLWKDSNDFDIEPLSEIDKTLGSLYLDGGKAALKKYLGTELEIDYSLINGIIESYRRGCSRVILKRMGREADDISFTAVNLSHTDVLIIEWTHGNNSLLKGIDCPILLYSTPEQTLAHRRNRARDRDVGGKFSNLILQLEQEKLLSQVESAKYIISESALVMKASDILSRQEE